MAYQDQFYTAGTVTVMNGSATVTGAGTGWETALIVGGVFYAGGGAYPIRSVSGETELTLAIPYAGIDAAGVGYAIDRQRAAAISNIAMNDRLAQIIREISIGNIEDLNALEFVANRSLTTDTAGNLTLVELGTLGRALLALTTGEDTQYVRGDGTLQSKTDLPISTATQNALNAKLNASSPSATGNFTTTGSIFSGGGANGKLNLKNSTGAQVAEIGVGVGTGYGDAVGYYTNVSSGSHTFFTNGTERLNILSNGTVNVLGTLSKAAGTFAIDHPLDHFNWNLRHGFVEAPRYDLIYRGTARLVGGRAAVDIDAASNMSAGTFAALTTNTVVTSLQNQDGFARLRPGPIDGGSFEIICEDNSCTDLVSWVVIAERNDPFVKSDLDQNTDSDGRFIPEFEKDDA